MGDTHDLGLIPAIDAPCTYPRLTMRAGPASHLTVYLEPAMAQQEGRDPSFA